MDSPAHEQTSQEPDRANAAVIANERIDPDALKVVRRLREHGYEAYLVGGCVRDLLLGRPPKDFDVATSATPDEMKRVFRNCRIIGRRFRLAHVFFGRKIIETATFRRNPRPEADEDDDLYLRHDNVFGTAEEDALRRDFTINGLFYDPIDRRLLDYVGGLEDLRLKVIRTIGEPDVRMREDPVRILRAVKFAARLGFSIDPATHAAMVEHRAEIHRCAPARVVEEIFRLMRVGSAAPSFRLLRETGVLEVVMPSLHAAVTGHGERGAEAWSRLLATLQALDRVARAARVQPSDPFILAALMRPFIDDLIEREETPGPLAHAIDARLRPWFQEIHAFRNDTERALAILHLQRAIMEPPEKVRRRRLGAFYKLYGEAVTVHGLYAEACGAVPASLEEWLALLASAAEAGEGEVAARGERERHMTGRPRRRRRGGRHRRPPAP